VAELGAVICGAVLDAVHLGANAQASSHACTDMQASHAISAKAFRSTQRVVLACM
jgi:hypothetical protein